MIVPPRSATCTLDDGGWTPLRITVALDEPLVGDLHRPLHADAALAYCAYLEHVERTGRQEPPIRAGRSPLDFEIGLATWTAPPTARPVDEGALAADGSAWGYATSAHTPVPAARTAVAVRRKPADGPMARYAGDKRHHLGAGPYKARDTIRPAAWIGDIVWDVLGDRTRVETLLSRLAHIGALSRHGYGRVQRVTVQAGGDRDGWRARAFPALGGPVEGVRAPYHHSTRQMPCLG